MKKYTLEDVEFIRTRANVTYDEAIGLLDAYEGDVVRVMAELERSGKLKNAAKAGESTFWETLKSLARKGYEHRMIIRKEERVIVNFSLIFWAVVTLFAWYIVIPALLLAVIFGYKIGFRTESGTSKDFANMAYTAKENIKKAAGTIRDEFKDAQAGTSSGTAGTSSGTADTNNPSQTPAGAQPANPQPVNPPAAGPRPGDNPNDEIIIE